MQKLKTHSGTKDRTKITKRGKVITGSPNQNHFRSKQSAARKRRLASTSILGTTAAKKVKLNLGA